MAYSCSGFDEINTNPDSATTATPGMLATGQLKEALRIILRIYLTVQKNGLNLIKNRNIIMNQGL